ncbi:MAG TPA: FAD-linked oxidase C-terminal domain-containing protein [Bryobacteraceae bacterium]|jgi:FAD/FMN-containing dehydrogenase/Fe-S oxidoreductase|nr:FAD-linked oxidase C-terminal domain-containing protein [Bryobacteraceae bacterium]
MATLLHESQIAWAQPRNADYPADEAKELEQALRKSIAGEVRFDTGSRALYATDASNYRQVPIGVIVPKTVEDVLAAVELCRRYNAPVLARGGGTSLAGQCCNVAVVFDFSKYLNKLLDLDPHTKTARVQPGIVLDWLRREAERHHLTFGPDPATHNHNTLGGMIGNNSCGTHSVMAGKTEENILELEVLTYDGLRLRVGATPDEERERIISAGGQRGEIYAGLKRIADRYGDEIRRRFPNIPRRVSGYNLPDLLPENGFHVARALVGTECTCALTLEATVKLVWSPPGRSLVVLGYPDIYSAGDHVPEILEFKPIACEAIDALLVRNMKIKGLHPKDLKLLPDGRGWLLVEFGGEDRKDSDNQARRLMDGLKRHSDAPAMKLYDDPHEEHLVWEIRESGLGATAWVPGEPVTWEGWEDSAVPPDKIAPYLRELCELYTKHGYEGALYGHFGQGCIHTRITFDLLTAKGIANYRSFMDGATSLVVKYGGSLSGEHGDGQSKAEFLPKMYGAEICEAFREFKSVWDPQGRMNPGKIVDPYPIDSNLRLGTNFAPKDLATHFHFIHDKDSFTHAAMRCVGIGECRRQEKGTMCPSYRATMEEKHSTRGRAHLLFEMMHGDVIRDGWKSEEVFDALDLCLSCKGCRSDCPVNVDMATYKAEFLSHYYENRLRPRYAYAMGWIHRWARIAAHFPRLANAIAGTPAAKRIAGIAPQRDVPKFAAVTFRDWFRRRGIRNKGKPEVILWADTFNNYFHPEVAVAATEVLEEAGFQVVVPGGHLCCGRPLYDYGFLAQADSLIGDVLTTLRPVIEAGTSVICLEPSCLAVFRDEMLGLRPHDEDAKRLHGQIFSLAEFLTRQNYTPPILHRDIVMHGHCHQKAMIGHEAEKTLFAAMGARAEIPDDGCCGMAGSFGFEAHKYDVSMAVYEHQLGPRLRRQETDTVVLADGFSCKTQIEQATGRRPLHLAQLLNMAWRGNLGTNGSLPALAEVQASGQRRGALLCAGLGIALAAWFVGRKILR